MKSSHPRRYNVIGDLNLNTGNMRLYNNGHWAGIRKLNISNSNEVFKWIQKDMEILS